MSDFPPLVFDPSNDPPTKQLQAGEELDIPLEDRFQQLKRRFNSLILFMLTQKFNLPDEVIGDDLWT